MGNGLKWLRGLFTCERLTAEQKVEFEMEEGLRTAMHMKFISVIVLVVVMLFSFIDYTIFLESNVYGNLNLTRFLFVGLFLLPFCIYFLINKKGVPQYVILINVLGYGLFLFLLSHIVGFNVTAIFHNTIGVVLLNVLVFLLFGLKPLYAFSVSGLLLMLVNINYQRITSVYEMQFSALDLNFWLVMITVVSFLVGVHLHILHKKAFLMHYQLKHYSQSRYKLFSIVSHDLKNIISAQATMTDFLDYSQDFISAEERSKMLKLMHKSSTDALSLFEDLTVWIKSQMDLIKPVNTTINVNAFIESQLEQFIPAIENKQIDIEFANLGLDEIITDATILSLVVRNILGNALKYSERGSGIKIIAAKKHGGFQFQVIDNGLGIPENKIKAIFDFDKEASSEGTEGERGTGMGLMLSKELLEYINGSIRIESDLGLGTKVYIDVA